LFSVLFSNFPLVFFTFHSFSLIFFTFQFVFFDSSILIRFLFLFIGILQCFNEFVDLILEIKAFLKKNQGT
jgi:hypothetical protein